MPVKSKAPLPKLNLGDVKVVSEKEESNRYDSQNEQMPLGKQPSFPIDKGESNINIPKLREKYKINVASSRDQSQIGEFDETDIKESIMNA
jgi:hypothetical protein